MNVDTFNKLKTIVGSAEGLIEAINALEDINKTLQHDRSVHAAMYAVCNRRLSRYVDIQGFSDLLTKAINELKYKLDELSFEVK